MFRAEAPAHGLHMCGNLVELISVSKHTIFDESTTMPDDHELANFSSLVDQRYNSLIRQFVFESQKNRSATMKMGINTSETSQAKSKAKQNSIRSECKPCSEMNGKISFHRRYVMETGLPRCKGIDCQVTIPAQPSATNIPPTTVNRQ